MKKNLILSIIILLLGGGFFVEADAVRGKKRKRVLPKQHNLRSRKTDQTGTVSEDQAKEDDNFPNNSEPEKRQKTAEKSEPINSINESSRDVPELSDLVDGDVTSEEEVEDTIEFCDGNEGTQGQVPAFMEIDGDDELEAISVEEDKHIYTFTYLSKQVEDRSLPKGIFPLVNIWGYSHSQFLFNLLDARKYDALSKAFEKRRLFRTCFRERIVNPDLLKKINSQDVDGITLLQQAVIKKDSKATSIILKNSDHLGLDSDMWWFLLYKAAVKNIDSITLEVLLAGKSGYFWYSSKLVDVNSVRDDQGKTLLHHLAVKSVRSSSKKVLGQIQQVVIILKKYGAKTDIEDNAGKTPKEYFTGKYKKYVRREYFL